MSRQTKPLIISIQFAFSLWLLMLAASAQAITPAGTLIIGQAEAAYFDTLNGEPVKVLSNQSSVIVAPVYALNLVQNQSNTVAPGQTVFFIHHLKNLGNNKDRFKLKATAYSGLCDSQGACQPSDLLKIDGVFAYQGDLPATGTKPLAVTPAMQPDSSMALIVMAQMSSIAKKGEQFSLKLEAVSEGDNAVAASNIDQVTTSDQSVLIRKKSLMLIGTGRSDKGYLEYDINFTNNGDTPLAERDVVIDGQPQKGVFLEDRIPANTALAWPTVDSLSYSPIQAIPVVYTLQGEWISHDKWQPETTKVSRIGLFLPSGHFRLGQSGHLSFTVFFDHGVQDGTVIRNQAGIDLEGGGQPTFVSNETVDVVDWDGYLPGGPAMLHFIEPADRITTPDFYGDFRDSKHYFKPDQLSDGASVFEDIYLGLRAKNFNTSSETIDFVDVKVTSGKTGDSVVVRLRQRQVNDGTFYSVSPLRLNKTAIGFGKLCTTPDNIPDYTKPAENCYLGSVAGDRLKAEAINSHTGKKYTDTADVSPNGLIFDSSSLAPVEGAVVHFYDIDDHPAKLPPHLVGKNRPTDLIKPQETEKDGRFFFPRMQEGEYYIVVDSPKNKNYRFPSSTRPEDYSGLKVKAPSYGKKGEPYSMLRAASYSRMRRAAAYSAKPVPGGAFHYDDATEMESFDIPLDPLGSDDSDLDIEKKALQEEVAPGEEVEYQLKVYNKAPGSLYNVHISDVLPAGFSYIEKSAQINGKETASPEFRDTEDDNGDSTRLMTFTVNKDPQWLELVPGAEFTLSYKLKAGSKGKEARNLAWAQAKDMGGISLYSDRDEAIVKVSLDGAITLEKEAKQKEVEPGGVVGYELKLHNNLTTSLNHVVITDQLPFGFKYAENSLKVKVDGKDVTPSAFTTGATMVITLDHELPAGKDITVEYVLKAGAGAIDSDGINRAHAVADGTLPSNEAKAQVAVKMDGVLSDKAILFGKVFVDSNCNNLQDSGEWPIGGVRLYMEDGTWAITDENGQYSLMGLKPGTHVVKVDPVTMPDGLILKPLDNRNAADGGSRFADMAPGEMHRADFAAMCPTGDYEKIFAQIKARNESITGDWLLDDAAQYNRSKPSEKADNNGDLSHGVIRAPQTEREQSKEPNKKKKEAPQTTATTDTKNKSSALNKAHSTSAHTMPQAKEAVKTITRDQGVKGTWLWPESQQADGRFMAVVRAGIQPVLYVNGQAVNHDRLGEQLVNSREQSQLLAWYGVALEDGENTVEIKATDFFGNERVLAKGSFNQSGSAEQIDIKPEAETLPADEGRSLLPVNIKLLDKNGLPARGVYFVTLETTGGRWQEADIQDQEPGHQVRIDQGELTVHLRSGNTSGPVTLRASTGDLKADTEITQIAAPRPLVAAGLVELNAGHGSVNGTVPNLDEITDGNSSDSRAAMFIKGEVAKDVQLTLSYDSDKDKDTELFRDVDPDDYYPITGDASQKGYEAQSRSKLYAKVEKDRSSIMWGDYQTDSNSSENDLAKIQRTLTGINGIYDNGETRVQGFAARPEDVHFSEVIQPNGTAMHYRLKQYPIVRHSDVVVLEVRDRDNPGLVIKSETLTRGRDYTLDEFSGYLKFSKPINSQVEEGNQLIRVNYDVDGDGKAYTVAGVRAQQKLNEKVKVGASYTHDGHESEGNDIGGAWVEYKPSEKTTIAVSGAHMTGKSAVEGSTDKSAIEENDGNAARVKVKHKWNTASETELTWARADKHFTNSSGGVSAGREETRLQHKQQLSKNLDARAEAEISRSLDDSNSSQGDSAGVYLDKKVGDGWKLTAGSRYIRQRNEDDHESYMTGQVGAEKRLKLLGKEASVKAEYEQALTNPRWRAALESDWKVHEKVSLYGRFERDDNLSPVSSGSDRNQFSLGLKSDWLPNTKSYSEYRMRGATDGQNLEWVNGTETRWEVIKGLSITPSVEWINTVSGDGDNDGLALSMGVQDKRHKNQRATGRVEYRHGKKQDYYGLDAAVARRLDLDWTGVDWFGKSSGWSCPKKMIKPKSKSMP